jgi:alpha-beta hydrolase superfamily lysophospholipase
MMATGTFAGWRDLPLSYRRWSAMGPARGVVVLVHGLGGHGGRFDPVALALAPLGYTLYAPDLPGHGRSPGPRGWIPCWDAFRLSLCGLLERVAAETAPQPLFLLGHSLGAAVVLDLVLRQPTPVRGVIVSNPAVDAEGVARWRRQVARLLSQLWPGFTLPTGISLEAACRDPAALVRYAADPLRHDRCTARLGTEFMATTAALQRDAGRFTMPLLVLQSGADRVTAAEAAHRFFEAIGSVDKTWSLYPRSFHELYEDLDRQQVFEDLAIWLDAHGG